jgi:hypothetical protein
MRTIGLAHVSYATLARPICSVVTVYTASAISGLIGSVKEIFEANLGYNFKEKLCPQNQVRTIIICCTLFHLYDTRPSA